MIPYHRTATTLVKQYSDIYPAVAINGPRQSGKTTLAQLTFPDKPYVSVEDFDTHTRAEYDPRNF